MYQDNCHCTQLNSTCSLQCKCNQRILRVLNGVQLLNTIFVFALPPTILYLLSKEYMHQNNCKDLISLNLLWTGLDLLFYIHLLFHNLLHAIFLLQTPIDNYVNHFTNLWFFEFSFDTVLTRFCEKWNVVSSDFLRIKNIVTLFFLSSLPMKLICCVKSVFLDSICLLQSIAISL